MSLLVHPVMQARWDAARVAARPVRQGTVRQVLGSGFEVGGIDAAIGDLVVVETDEGPLRGLVVGLRGDVAFVSAYEAVDGLRCGQPAVAPGGPPRLAVGPALLGRVVDGLGQLIDGGPAPTDLRLVDLDERAPHPLRRQLIDRPMSVGVRAIDAAITCGRGQRIGIFSGSGVGKSTLLSMMVREADADVVVIGLVGERGREVREFIDNDLGPEGLARSVLVVATGDEAPLMRLSAAQTATRIAEAFRDEGKDVLLLIDSVTRFAMAQREIGLAAGEFPASRGYPPSVLSVLPRLLERAGAGEHGTITALYTVLVEGDDHNEPIADAARSILDGHVVLSRSLAAAGHYPAIDALASVSRVADAVTDEQEQRLAGELRHLMAAHAEARDLIEIGAYVPGTNPTVDRAVSLREAIDGFLRQRIDDRVAAPEAFRHLADVLGQPS